MPSPTKVPRSTMKELRALVSGLSLDGEEMENMGMLPMLSPVRVHGHLRAQLGVDQVGEGACALLTGRDPNGQL